MLDEVTPAPRPDWHAEVGSFEGIILAFFAELSWCGSGNIDPLSQRDVALRAFSRMHRYCVDLGLTPSLSPSHG